MQIYTNGEKINAEIVGILKPNETLQNDETYEHLGQQELGLDYAIIVPYFQFNGAISTENQKQFVLNEYINQLTGTLIFSSKDSQSKIEEELKTVNEYYLENQMFTVKPSVFNNGLAYFQSETYDTMKALEVVIILLVVF